MAAVALIVAMLAQLVTQRRYEGLFGNTLTHHYVLIDDSMSMTDREGGTDAFDRALEVCASTGRGSGQDRSFISVSRSYGIPKLPKRPRPIRTRKQRFADGGH